MATMVPPSSSVPSTPGVSFAMHLLGPLVFRNGVRAKNRVALAAMTNGQSHDDGTLGDDELAWLTRRADGGFGIVATCAAHVAKDGQGWAGELGVFDDAQLPGLKTLARALHDRGALVCAQLYNGGLPNHQNGNELTMWVQANDFSLAAPATVTGIRFWAS